MQATCSQNLLKPFWVLKPYLHYFTQSNISPTGSAASVRAITKCIHWIFILFIVLNYKLPLSQLRSSHTKSVIPRPHGNEATHSKCHILSH